MLMSVAFIMSTGANPQQFNTGKPIAAIMGESLSPFTDLGRTLYLTKREEDKEWEDCAAAARAKWASENQP